MDEILQRLEQPTDSTDLHDALRALAQALEAGAVLPEPWRGRLRQWKAEDAAAAGWLGVALAALDGDIAAPHKLRLFRALWSEDEDEALQQRAARAFAGEDLSVYRDQLIDATLEGELDPVDLWYARRILAKISFEMCRDYAQRTRTAS